VNCMCPSCKAKLNKKSVKENTPQNEISEASMDFKKIKIGESVVAEIEDTDEVKEMLSTLPAAKALDKLTPEMKVGQSKVAPVQAGAMKELLMDVQELAKQAAESNKPMKPESDKALMALVSKYPMSAKMLKEAWLEAYESEGSALYDKAHQ